MTDTQTPGPWTLKEGNGSHWLTSATAGYDFAVIESLVPEDEGQANAQLLVAASDLLDALRPLAAFYETLSKSDLENEETLGNIILYEKFELDGRASLKVADIVAAHEAIKKAEKG